MNGKNIAALLVFLVIIGLIGGAAVFFSKSLAKTPGLDTVGDGIVRPHIQAQAESPIQEVKSNIQDELNDLSAKMVADLNAEQRINLSMVSQLRAYQAMLGHIQTYAEQVEKQIDIIEEISKEEFQEDVSLQASLFNGKKADLVAKHLEEFRASRVGAILAKMKEKEASAVLDIWAKQEDPRVSAFYREAMAAYLNNKRRDLHPDLFSKKSEGVAAQNKGVPR